MHPTTAALCCARDQGRDAVYEPPALYYGETCAADPFGSYRSASVIGRRVFLVAGVGTIAGMFEYHGWATVVDVDGYCLHYCGL